MSKGGKREGAGRKREGTTYEAGYQAGYKSFERRLGMSFREIINLVMTADISEEQRAQILENLRQDTLKRIAEHKAKQ